MKRHRFRLLRSVWLASCVLLQVILQPGFSQTIPSLINYQGRLTDAEGITLPGGTYRVAFRLWSDPASESIGSPNHLIWGAQYEVTLLSNGVFNVILGAPGGAAIPSATVDDIGRAFTEPTRYLGLTIIETPGGVVPAGQQRELRPRHQILSSPFAFSAQTAASVLPQSITSESIRIGAIGAVHLADGAVPFAKLAQRDSGTNVTVGGIAISKPVLRQRLTRNVFEDIQNLEVTIHTTGRPVLAFVAPGPLENYNAATAQPGDGAAKSGVYFITDPGADVGVARLLRNGGEAAVLSRFGSGAGGSSSVGYPSLTGMMIDLPPAGPNTYKVQWGFQTSGAHYAEIYNSVLVVFEL